MWSWGQEGISEAANASHRRQIDPGGALAASRLSLYCEGASEFVFTENETNNQRLFGSKNTAAHVKDAFHDYIVHGKTDAVNPAGSGTKASPVYRRTIAPGETSSSACA